jgi:hypothetical protein
MSIESLYTLKQALTFQPYKNLTSVKKYSLFVNYFYGFDQLTDLQMNPPKTQPLVTSVEPFTIILPE